MAETELVRDHAKQILAFIHLSYKSILEASDDKHVSAEDIEELLKLNQGVRDRLLAIRDKKIKNRV